MSRTIIFLSISVALLASAMTAYGLWYRYAAQAADRAAALATEIAERRMDLDRARDAEARLASLAEDEVAIQKHFVSTQDVVPFLESLERTGSALGADVEVVSVGAVTEPRPSLNVSLKITGGFDSVLRTLGAIEYAPYDIEIVSLTFDTVPTGTASAWTAAATFVIGTRDAAIGTATP